jgi:hypothetical protein
VNAVDGTPIPGPPLVDHDEAVAAVEFACGEHDIWAKVDLDERRARVSAAVDALSEHHELLALLLVWEIGKPWRLACADVERCIDGVRWYLGQIERQLQTPDGGQRQPLPGPVSNIASWNYPMSVQVHAELVQALCGNAVVAKTPSQGGFHTLTLAHALMRRAGLPVTLISGMGSRLGDVLIRSEGIGALVFVGGRANGRRAAVSLADTAPAPHARAGGAQRLGGVGLLAMGAPGPAHSKGLRVRQAAVHRLSPLRRPAPSVPRLPRDVPPGLAGGAIRPPARGRAPGRSAPRVGLRTGHPLGEGDRSVGPVRRGPARRGHSAL